MHRTESRLLQRPLWWYFGCLLACFGLARAATAQSPAPVINRPVQTAGWSFDSDVPLWSAANSSEGIRPTVDHSSFAQARAMAERQSILPVAAQATPPAVEAPPADYAPLGYAARPFQDAPGVPEYAELTQPMPQYTYRQNYYNQPGIGARPMADYAPWGYEAREFQDAPGAPEFTPLAPPVPITPEEREKFVVRGLYPGSFLVPGTNTSFRLRGFVRMTGLFDFDPIGSRDDFVTNTIPVPQDSGQNFNVSARYSRFALETWTPTSFCDWNVHTFIEGDFFNGPAQAVGGGGNPFRLRFAFVDFGYFRVGQQNTVFMDNNAFPSTVDFAGPRGLANLRRTSARMTLPLTDTIFWATGVEQPFSDITIVGNGDRGVQDVPDFATHLRYQEDLGHIQLSTIIRTLGYRPLDEELTRRAGWGFSSSTVFHPWALLNGTNPVRDENPTGWDRSRILLQHTFGWGISRYIQDTAGLGLDGQVDPLTGAFDTVYAVGWSASYEHWFDEHFMSNVTWSEVYTGHGSGQPGNTYAAAKYLASSLWWIPVRNLSFGVEYVWGERENLDGQNADADRINALVQYNF
ncbi:MAG: porin [Planctomycetaceae bacterium]|nr:porin [Planctomycetaceae bacterium]